MKRPTHGTLAAYLALFISLGGTGYAATQLAPNSVGSAQIRNGSVQSRDLARSVFSKQNAKLASTITDVVTDPASGLQINVNATDGKDGAAGPMGPVGPQGDPSQIPGPQGVQGVQGDKGETGAQGNAGMSVGAGHVDASGAPDGLQHLVLAAHTTTGVYCFNYDHGSLTSGVAVVSTDADDGSYAAVVRNPQGQPCGAFTGHPQTADFMVVTHSQGGAQADHGFFIIAA